MFTKGRLQPNQTVEAAGANLQVVMQQLATSYPATNKDRKNAVKRSSDVHIHPEADKVLLPIAAGLMLVVGLVLLIACANVASMASTVHRARVQAGRTRDRFCGNRVDRLRRPAQQAVLRPGARARQGDARRRRRVRLAQILELLEAVVLLPVLQFARQGSIGLGAPCDLRPTVFRSL
jgi:hypothetical protein